MINPFAFISQIICDEKTDNYSSHTDYYLLTYLLFTNFFQKILTKNKFTHRMVLNTIDNQLNLWIILRFFDFITA